MDGVAIQQSIASLGFPIAACIGMAWYVVSQQKENNKILAGLTDALNNNTLALNRLLDKEEK